MRMQSSWACAPGRIQPNPAPRRTVETVQTWFVEVAALFVGIALGVGGWIASGVLARRDARRTLRVEFLISAYRRLDAASNRSMSPEGEREIELATSDIQLFGSTSTIELANEFVREFASNGRSPVGSIATCSGL